MNKQPTSIWQHCQGQNHVQKLSCKAWRVVEAQHISSTRNLVDTLDEHDVLENLIERVKPPLPKAASAYHYLLATPFRYPPLEYGSRFGGRFEPSLWYGSLALQTALCEVAYYRFLFINASEADFGMINVAMTAYAAKITSTHAVDLTKAPFAAFEEQISSPATYEHSQLLGPELRESNIDSFLYRSARAEKPATNIALFSVSAFAEKSPIPDTLQTWQCYTTSQQVEFVRTCALTEEQWIFPQTLFH